MSSGNSDIIDLTADVVRESAPPTSVQPKKRLLPATVLTTSTAVPVVRNPSSAAAGTHYVPYIGVTGRVLPTSLLGQVRLPAPVPSGSANGYGNTQPNKPIQYAIPNARITFSIVNSRFFTARAEFGKIAPEVINTFNMIQGAKFDWETCKWIFPLNGHDILAVALSSQHKHFVEPLPRYTIAAAQLKNQRDQQVALNGGMGSAEESLLALKGHIPDKVLHLLAPFQREAVQFVMSNKGRALVADEMGLGKTRTAITSAMAYRDDWPVLVVSPSSARHHWQAEILSVLHPDFIDPKDISVVEGSAHPIYKGAQYFRYKVLIISYHLVSKLSEILLQIPFNVVIVDESHYMKNSGAQRTKMLMPLLHKAKRAILLSGTPALSRPIELFTQLHALAPKQWPNEKDFAKRYCSAPKNNRGGKALQAGFGSSSTANGKSWSEYSGASNMEELHMMLTATIMIRRLKKDILKQLPEKQRHIVKVEISDTEKRDQMQELLGLAAKFEEKLSLHKKSRSEGAERQQEAAELEEMRVRKKHVLMELFTMSGEAKLPAILQHLGNFLDNPLSGKVLVFCHHRSVMDGLARFLAQRGEECIRIDGQTASKDRHSRVQHFQASTQCRVALLAITAAGIALTLTAAATVYFAELFWTPAALMQAEDRAHRIGQTSTVKVTYFLAKGSVDELLWPLVRLKMKLLGEIVEGSKELDFQAEMEADTAGDAAGAEESEDGRGNSSSSSSSSSGGLKMSASSSSLGGKRSFGNTGALVKEEEIGDLAHEIASEIKLTERQQKQKQKEKQQQRGKKGTEDSDNEEEEEDSNSSAEDDDAVVAIAEPDPLAQLYMNMHQANKNASRRTVSAASSANYAGSSSGGSSGGFGGRQGVPFNPSGPLLLSHTGFPAGGVGSGSSSRMGGVGGAVVDMSQDEDGRQCVSLMSPEVPRGRLAASANPYIGAASGSGSGETVVIDLLDDDENDAQQGRPDPRSYNKPLSSTSDPAQGSDYSYNEFADDGDIRIHGSSNQGRNFSSTIVQDESGDFPQTDVFEEAQQVPVDTPSVLTTLRRQEGSGVVDPAEGTALFTKQEMISRANQVWNSAHLAHAPKTVKPAMKFAPSLKKGDSTNSLKRVEERLAMAAVSPTSTAAAAGVPSSSTATAADTEVLGTSMDISAYSAAATPVSSCFSSPAVTACDAGVLETIMDISTNAAAIIAAVPPSSSAVSAATIDAGVLDMSMDISTTACSSVVNSAATATAEDQSAAEVTI